MKFLLAPSSHTHVWHAMCTTPSSGSANELMKSDGKIFHFFHLCASIYWKCQGSTDIGVNLTQLVWFFSFSPLFVHRSGDDIGPESRAKRWYVH